MQSLLLLLHRWPALAQSCANRSRAYLLAPNAAFALQADGQAPPVLEVATRLFAKAIQTYRSRDAIVSALYSVINLLPVHNKVGTSLRTAPAPDSSLRHSIYSTSNTVSGRSLDSKETISGQGVIDTVIYVVSMLAAVHFTELREVARLAISVLLQRLLASTDHTEEAVLAALVRLGSTTTVSTDEEFSDIVKALAESATSATASPQSREKVIDFQHQLALAVAHKPPRAEIYLSELLTMLVNKTLARTSTKHAQMGSSSPDAADLLGLLSVLAVVLQSSHSLDSQSYSDELTASFRELWFLCTTTPGLAADNRDLTADDKLVFTQIAQKTPCLINGANLNYVETDLEYDSVLRRHHSGAHVGLPYSRPVEFAQIPD